jgi:hypothetical protein
MLSEAYLVLQVEGALRHGNRAVLKVTAMVASRGV